MKHPAFFMSWLLAGALVLLACDPPPPERVYVPGPSFTHVVKIRTEQGESARVAAGEWLIGPAVTARYGGALLWITVVTLLAQYLYNVEASRYTLYTGEGIMTGKLRLRPGARFWTVVYGAIDIWSMLPYQLAGVSVTLAAVLLGRIPNPSTETELMRAADAIVTLSEPMRDHLVGRSIPAERITVVPNGVPKSEPVCPS